MIQTTNQLKLCWVEIIILFLVDPIVIISQRGMCAAQSTPGFPKKTGQDPNPCLAGFMLIYWRVLCKM